MLQAYVTLQYLQKRKTVTENWVIQHYNFWEKWDVWQDKESVGMNQGEMTLTSSLCW